MPSSAFGADDDHRAAPPVLGPGDFGEMVEDEIDAGGDDRALGIARGDPVFVPTAWAPDDEGLVEVQLRRTDHEELALPIYTSAERLGACCGEDQPFVVYPAAAIPALMEATGATAILPPDTALPSSERGE